MRRSPHLNGIVLVLVMGILVLLSLTAVGMAGMVVQLRRHSSVVVDQASARLLAHSGMEYAFARLYQVSSQAQPASSENQADDWICRDDPAVPIERSLNPSYAQTEPYTDSDGNGRYDLGLDPVFTDLNGNGRFDAWSGRLRERGGAIDSIFSLRIDSAGGGLCVNGGILDAEDRNGNGTPDYADLGQGYMRPGAGKFTPLGSYYMCAPPDPVTKRNGRIADVLSRLGRILENPLPLPQPWDVTLPAGLPVAVPYSAVGEKLVRGRPLGGYRSLQQVRAVLTPEEWGRMRGTITLEPGGMRSFGSLDLRPADCSAPNRLIPEKRQLIDLNHAALSVLESLALDLQPGGVISSPERDPDDLTTLTHRAHSITRIEALRLAQFLESHRPFASWYDFYRRLDAAKGDLFAGQHAATQRQWVDMLFANAYPKLMGTRLKWRHPPFSYLTYDIDRDGGYPLPRLFSKLEGVAYPPTPPNAPQSRPYGAVWIRALSPWCRGPRPADGGWQGYFMNDNRLPYGSLEYDLDPGASFRLECLGGVKDQVGGVAASAVLRASLRMAESVWAGTQADFENRGLLPPPDGVKVRERPAKDRTETYPMYPLDAVAELAGAPDAVFTPYAGSVRLADRVAGLRGDEAFYVPGWQGGRAEAWENHFRDRVAGVRWAQSHQSYDWVRAECAGPQDLLASGFAVMGAGPVTWENQETECCHSHPPDSLYDGIYRWGGGSGPEEEGPTWGRYGAANGGDFPLVEQGEVRRGTFQFWSAGAVNNQVNPMRVGTQTVDRYSWSQAAYAYSSMYTLPPEQPVGGPYEEFIEDPAASTGFDWHIAAFTIDAGGEPQVTMYIDGIQRGSGHYAVNAVDPNWKQAFTCTYDVFSGNDFQVSRGQDEIRMCREPLNPRRIGVQALQSRYWTPDPGGPVPSFRSPLYSFPRPVPMTGARYDGFAPRTVRQATESWNGANPDGRKAPMRVRLLFYAGTDGDGPCREVDFPVDSYLDGGCLLDLRGIRAGSFRYVVEMDVSALEGFNNETPVFDGLSVTYRIGSFPLFDPSDR